MTELEIKMKAIELYNRIQKGEIQGVSIHREKKIKVGSITLIC